MNSSEGYAKDNRSAPLFSLIVPAYNEQNYLPLLLDTVETAKTNYKGRADALEVIVINNGSTDRTEEISKARGCRVIYEEKRIIGAVRNAGAAAAEGSILAFVDADSRIHPNTFNAIEHAMSNKKKIAGATGVHMERMSPGIAVTYMIMVPMVWVTGMDTGVVFCRKEDFVAIHGYNEQKLFAEDVDFLWRMRSLGRSRGQRLTRITSVKAIASTRKFDEYGDWHYLSLIARTILGLLFSPHPFEKFAKKYWYGDKRK